MPMEFVTLSEKDFGNGMDQQSAENRVQPGYVQSLMNMDPQSTGSLKKRRGYQGYAGNLPLRVAQLEQTGSVLSLIFPDGVAVPLGRSQPLLVKGLSSVNSPTNDFSTFATQYYANFTSDIRKTMAAGTGTVTLPQNEHLVSTASLFVGTALSTSQANYDTELVEMDSVRINKATYDVSLDFVNGTGSSKQLFLFVADKTPTAGTAYTFTTTVAINTGTTTVSIPQGTHGLSNTNIQLQCYHDTGTEYQLIKPDAIRLNELTGQVELDFFNNTTIIQLVVVLGTAPLANTKVGTIGANSTTSVVITNPDSAFGFFSPYVTTGVANVLEAIEPDAVTYDEVSNQTTLVFVNNSSTSQQYELYWSFTEVTTNRISVTANTSATFTDDQPQLTVYGLDHAELYNTADRHEGWTSYLDSYRAAGETRLLAGLGGNIFSAQSDTVSTVLYPRLNNVVASDTVIGPAFWDTTDVPTRSRGYIQGSTVLANAFRVLDITYTGVPGEVLYRLSVPNRVITGTLSTIISTVQDAEDQLTVRQAGWAIHNGSFKILDVNATTPDELAITVQNSLVDSADFDDLDTGATAGIFTDQLVTTGLSVFLPNDTVLADNLTESQQLTVAYSLTTRTVLQEVIEELTFPAGLIVSARRQARVIPLRGAALTSGSSVTNLVRGDMLSYTEVGRELRVLAINQQATLQIDITADGTEAIVEMQSGSTVNQWAGKRALLNHCGPYSGEQVITRIIDLTHFAFATTLTDSTTNGLLVGNTIEVDEQLQFQSDITNTNQFAVPRRWIPVEHPSDSYNQTQQTRVHYFTAADYFSQPILKSVMSQASTFLTNGSDKVHKYDGQSLYHAGLPRWQSTLFAGLNEAASIKLVVGNPSHAPNSISQNAFVFSGTPANADSFLVGDRVKHSSDGMKYTVRAVTEVTSGGPKHVIVDRVISSATAGTITKVSTFRYYARLNTVDLNNGLNASAIVGYADNIVEVAADAAVELKLIGLPVLDNLDFDNIRVQLYRTKANTQRPFYKVADRQVQFNAGSNYLDFTDTTADDSLSEDDLDEISTALSGDALRLTWQEPPIAKYCTASVNRLVLANISAPYRLDMNFFSNAADIPQSSFLNSAYRRYLFRRDSLDTGTISNSVDRQAFEFTTSNTRAVSSVTGTLDTSFLVTTGTNHGLSVGDWVYLFHSSLTTNKSMQYCGWFQINSTPALNTLVINYTESGSGAAALFPDTLAFASTATDVPVYLGTDGNYGAVNGNNPISSWRFLAAKRLADAVNAWARGVDTTISGYDAYAPWIIANAGNEFASGQLILQQTRATTEEVIALKVPALSSAKLFSVYVNELKQSGNAQADAVALRFPSRIVASFENYPELFDNCYAAVDTDSKSAVDVNPADGEEVTAVIPFFGDTAFGAAQKGAVVVVFKTNSVYLVDLAAKAAGQPCVQRLETTGKGCTAPSSPTVTRNGIIFANESGIYRLLRSLEIDYIGKRVTRTWQTTNKALIGLAAGHHDRQNNLYKLSYVVDGSTIPEQAVVYDHTREYEQQRVPGPGGNDGSWTQYSNHSALMWANLGTDSYWASPVGRVFVLRNQQDETDYRDDSSAIEAKAVLRALSGDDGHLRKAFRSVVVEYRGQPTTDDMGTVVAAAIDFSTEFLPLDPATISAQQPTANGLSTGAGQLIEPIQYSVGLKNGVWFQLKVTNAQADTGLEVTGIAVRTAAKSDQGIKQAAQTR